MNEPFFEIAEECEHRVLRLLSLDGTNKLTRARVEALSEAVERLAAEARPLVITGNEKFFSAGADLREIAALDGASAFEFARMGQRLMRAVDEFPAQVTADIRGYCMGGGLDLALACDVRRAAANAVFGHRGAALGIMTGWGGTQRLPRLIGRAAALEMFLAAKKVDAKEAMRMGLVDGMPDSALPG